MGDPEPIGEPTAVRNEIPVDPDDDVIDFQLEEAAFENAQVNDTDEMGDAVRKRIEQKLAGLKILEGTDREVGQQSIGSASKSIRGNTLDRLRREVDNLDPSGELLDRGAANWIVTRASLDEDEDDEDEETGD